LGEGEVDGEVEVDAEDVGLDGGAEADSGLQAGRRGRPAAGSMAPWAAAPHVGAHAQLQRVPGAPHPAAAAAWGRRAWRWRRRRAVGVVRRR
jgi:hypothetical protein